MEVGQCAFLGEVGILTRKPDQLVSLHLLVTGRADENDIRGPGVPSGLMGTAQMGTHAKGREQVCSTRGPGRP